LNRKPHTLALIAIILASLACSKLGQSDGNSEAVTATEPAAAYNPCMNVFLPFESGASWIYEVKRESGQDTRIGLTVSQVEDSQATLDLLDMSTSTTFRTIAECDEGAIQNYPTLSLGMLASDIMQGNIEVEYVSGVFMPAESEFLEDDWALSWEGAYIANGTLTVEDDGETFTITLEDSPVQMQWQVEGQEPVTVQAGTFDQAYILKNHTEVKTSLTMLGFLVDANLALETRQWYAPGIGLLKSVVDGASLGYRDISLPVYIRGETELLEFRSGQ